MSDVYKFLLDGNIFDVLIVDHELCNLVLRAVQKNRIQLISTWVEKSEIDAMPINVADKWARIENLRSKLQIENVKVAGMILGHARLDNHKFVSWDESQNGEKAIAPSGNNVNDVALAMTAKSAQAILVTEDKELQNKAREIIKVQVLDANGFGRFLANFD